MKNNILALTIILLTVTIFQISGEGNLVDYNGRQIIINDNFTWEYVKPEKISKSVRELEINNADKTLITSNNNKYGAYIDLDKWSRTTGINAEAELQFKNSEDTAYAMIIHEGLEIPLESMKELIIVNANNIDPNARILNSEKCRIGTITGELVTYTAKSAGLDFIFYSFIATSRKGTIQFTCFTLNSEFDQLKPDFIELISGFSY